MERKIIVANYGRGPENKYLITKSGELEGRAYWIAHRWVKTTKKFSGVGYIKYVDNFTNVREEEKI